MDHLALSIGMIKACGYVKPGHVLYRVPVRGTSLVLVVIQSWDCFLDIQSWSVLLRKNIQHTVTDKLVKEQLKPEQYLHGTAG